MNTQIGVQIYNYTTDMDIHVISQRDGGFIHRQTYRDFILGKKTNNPMFTFRTRACYFNMADAINHIVEGRSSKGAIENVPSCVKIRAIKQVQEVFTRASKLQQLEEFTKLVSKEEQEAYRIWSEALAKKNKEIEAFKAEIGIGL